MAFSHNQGCPEGWTRDEWMREVPRNETTGEFIEDALPCDLPLAGYWICAAVLIFARMLLGLTNMYVLLAVRESGNKGRRRMRGLAPAFDILNTIFVILFVGLAPVTSSRIGATWVLFGLAFTPYFVSGILFLMKMIRNRRRIGTSASGGSSGSSPVVRLGNPNFKLRSDSWVMFLLSCCWIGTIGCDVVWIIGAALGGNVICHRLAIVFFTLMTSTAQLVGFSESVHTAMALSRHIQQTGTVTKAVNGSLRTVRFKLLRTALVFVPLWASSTFILLFLASGVLPFYWYITFILMSMPVINAISATAMFFRRRRKSPNARGDAPMALKIADSQMIKVDATTTKVDPSTIPNKNGMSVMKSDGKSYADMTALVLSDNPVYEGDDE